MAPARIAPKKNSMNSTAVADQHGDALARTHAETGEHRRHAVHPLVELPVGGGALPAAEQVDDRDLVGEPPDGGVEEIAEIAAAIGIRVLNHGSMIPPRRRT